MRSYWKAGVTVWLGLFSATAALAQSQNWTITIGADQKIVDASTTLQKDKVNIVTQNQPVTVNCPSGVDCTQVRLRLVANNASTKLDPTSQSAASSAFLVPAGVSKDTNLVVAFPAGTDIGTFPLGPNNGSVQPPVGQTGNQVPPPTLAQLLALQCPSNQKAGYAEPTREERRTKRKEAKKNKEGRGWTSWWENPQAEGGIVVTPLGDVLASGLDTLFDENDVLVVTVVADKRLLPLLTVDRTSAFRDVTAVQILGAGQPVPDLVARQGAPVADCGTREFRLENFAPGQGKVQISALQGTTPTPIGNFEFNVNALYSGMLTLGAARTKVVDPTSFSLASVGGQTVIAAEEDGDDDLVYTLFYTPFLWGKRDIQKSVPFWQHLNLSIGLAPEAVTDNAFAGITADLPAGIAVTWGWHFRQVETLTQGLAVGSPFTGTADQIPTTKDWDDGKFWAVSIDLRAMVQVLRAAMGTGGGS
jgi:hypothetical protein